MSDRQITITLSGPQGSGKTTLAETIGKALEGCGYSVRSEPPEGPYDFGSFTGDVVIRESLEGPGQ